MLSRNKIFTFIRKSAFVFSVIIGEVWVAKIFILRTECVRTSWQDTYKITHILWVHYVFL